MKKCAFIILCENVEESSVFLGIFNVYRRNTCEETYICFLLLIFILQGSFNKECRSVEGKLRHDTTKPTARILKN